MRFVLLHYHFLKNAGSTIENILDRNFGERFLRIDTANRSGHLTNEALMSQLEQRPEVVAISSHQIRHPLPAARGYLFFDICFLRDPIDRIRSMYDYFRQRPSEGDRFSELANRSTLGEFVTCLVDHFPEEVTNVQVALLANGGVDEQPPGERDFEIALERMLETSFLGVVHRFGESAAAGRWFLDPVFPNLDCAEPPANVSGGLEGTVALRRRKLRAACGRRVYTKLLRLNALDCELFRRARAEVRRRFALIPMESVRPADRVSTWMADRRLRNSGLFDPKFYLERYPDVQRAGVDPLRHYLRHGAAEGRKPHPLFEPDYYLRRCPEARDCGNPLLHFLENGGLCSPHPLFDCRAYVEQFPDAARQPLVHFLKRASPSQAEDLKILDAPVSLRMWKTSSGRTEFEASPEQRPFFRVVKFEQWRAQFS